MSDEQEIFWDREKTKKKVGEGTVREKRKKKKEIEEERRKKKKEREKKREESVHVKMIARV